MEQQAKVAQLKTHLEGFLSRLENLDPNKTSVEDIDQLLQIIERMENELR